MKIISIVLIYYKQTVKGGEKIKKQIILLMITLTSALLLCSVASATEPQNNSNIDDHSQLTGPNAELPANNSVNEDSKTEKIISGVVTNCHTKYPFPGVTVKASSLNGTELATTTTEEKGFYRLAFLSNESIFKVTASYPGHASSTQEITVTSNLNDPLDPNLYGSADFQLSPFVLTKGSWDVIGLDSNNVNVGPNQYLIQIHVNNGATPATNVSAQITFGAGTSLVHLATGETSTKNLGNMAANTSKDIFYLIAVDRNAAAYGQTRAYTVTLLENGVPTGNTITGLLDVRQLLSQNRNHVDSIVVSNPTPSLGDTFAVTVTSHTASTTYNVVNLPLEYDPTKVQPISYTVTYGPNTSNNLMLNNPGQTNYISVWTFLAVGAGVAPLYGIITDRSGNSYHYNTDYGTATIVTVTPRADLAITKLASPTTVAPGDLVTFTIVVTNYGPNTSSGFTVTDSVSSFLNNPEYWDGFNWIPWTGTLAFGSLDVGSGITFNIRGNFIAQPTPQVNNLANVTGIEEDPNLTNNQDIAILNQTTPTADLTISKIVDNNLPNLGDIITYTIKVQNAGPDNAENVYVDDTWPSGLSFLSATPSQGTFNPATYRWTIGTIAHGASATLTILAKTLQTGLITNTATVFSTTTDPHPDDDSSSVDVNVQPVIDLAVTKTVNNPTPNVGQNVVFSITVTNNGPSAATGVIVNDLLPVGLQFVSANPQSGTYNSSTGIWNIGNLAAGSTLLMAITATVTQTGQITNTAAATGNENDHDPTNNEDSVSLNGEPSADLNLVKNSNILMPNNGDTITLTFTLKNNGPNDATNVVVDDPLLVNPIPNGLEFISYISSQGTYSNGVWTVGNLPHSATITLEILAKVIRTGIITNIATATATEFDPHPEDNTSGVTLDVQPTADLTVTKTGDDSTPNPGDTVNFTITVRNIGPDTATNIIMVDGIPTGISSYGSPSSISQGTFNPSTGIWNVGTLISGGTATLIFPVVISNPFTGQINNIAVVSGTEFDPNPTNNQDIYTMFVQTPPVDLADLSIQKTVDNPTPHIGDIITYTINLYNAGPNDALNVVVNELVTPAWLTFVSSSVPSPGFTYDDNTGIGTWTVNTLVHNTLETLILKFRVERDGLITNAVEATSTTPDPHTDDNKASVTVNGQPSADIEVQKTVSPNPQNYGQEVTHTITVTNNGPSTATGVIVNDLLPPGTPLIYVSSSQGSFNPINNAWNIGTLTDHQTVTLNIVFRVNATGTITNTATKTHQNEFDPDTTNDSSTATLQVPPAADLSITKTVSNPQPYIHEIITSTLIVQNHGPDAATNIYVVDNLPDGLKFISSNANYGSYDPQTGIWTIGSLPSGAVAVLTINTSVEKYGPLENHAHVYSSTYDPIFDNQSATASINVRNPANAQVNAATIPMQKTGLPLNYLVFAILMVLSGIFISKRK